MNRRALLLIAVLVAASLATGTGGISAMSADRGFDARIVDDDDAYIGFQQEAVTTKGTTNLSVTVTNQFPAGTTLETVEISVDGETRYVGPLDPGEVGTATFEFVDCGDSIDVEASGDGVQVSFSRPVECG